jgi:hypothetical protein
LDFLQHLQGEGGRTWVEVVGTVHIGLLGKLTPACRCIPPES